MTLKHFWVDPYATRLDTRVAMVDGDEVTLDATILYALSGGQESDHGTIGGRPVLAARKDGKEIRYRLAAGHGLAPGEAVEIAIDWQRRYRLMRLHFAAEIVLELLYQRFPALAKVGAHIAAEKARIDVAWEGNIAALLPELQQTAQAIIDSDQPVESEFGDEMNERRYWKIRDFAEVPCGGTHLKRTGEVGKIRLKRVNLGKGKERIEIFAE